MDTQNNDVYIAMETGAWGYHHDQWIDSYYPEELPEDWLFSYYSKEFRTLVLTDDEMEADLVYTQTHGAPEWIDDLYDEFKLYIELKYSRFGQPEFLGQIQNLINMLGNHFSGFVFIDDSYSEGIANQLAEFSRKLGVSISLSIHDKHAAELYAKKFKNNQDIYFCWHPQLPPECKNCPLMLVDDEQIFQDLRKLGELLQEFKQQNINHEDLAVIVKGIPPSVKIMKQTQAIIALI